MGNIYLPNAFNRYAYVLNNPLSFTDTSGLCFLGCFWQSPIFGVVLDVGLFAVGLPELELTGGLVWGTSLTEQIASLGLPTILANGALAGAVSAGVTGGNVLKGAAFGALGAGLAFGVAPIINSTLSAGITSALGLGTRDLASAASAFIAQGLTGGVVSVAQGGNFGSGFLAGGVGSLAGQFSEGQFDAGKLILSAALGAADSALGGGKFTNGAITGAFAYAASADYSDATGQETAANGASDAPEVVTITALLPRDSLTLIWIGLLDARSGTNKTNQPGASCRPARNFLAGTANFFDDVSTYTGRGA